MERLTAEDMVMLWPDEVWPQEIGCLAVLDGASLLDPDGRFRIEDVRAAVAGRLHRVPRFRQLLYRPRPGLGPPLWVDATAFDLRDHVRVLPVPAPGDEAQLLLTTEQLRLRRLDPSRPLWEMWFLPGLPENRIGLLIKIHHAMADGIAGMATIGALLDDHSRQARRTTTAMDSRGRRQRHVISLQTTCGGGLTELGRVFSKLVRPVTTLRQRAVGVARVGRVDLRQARTGDQLGPGRRTRPQPRPHPQQLGRDQADRANPRRDSERRSLGDHRRRSARTSP